MRRILFAAVAASALAVPAFAQQVTPTGTGVAPTPQAGISTTETPSISTTENPVGTDPTDTSNLGLGGLLQQQTQSGGTGLGAIQPDIHQLLETKPRAKKARGH